MSIQVDTHIIKVDPVYIPLVRVCTEGEIFKPDATLKQVQYAMKAVETLNEMIDLVEIFNDASRDSDLEDEYYQIQKLYNEWDSYKKLAGKGYICLQIDDSISKCMEMSSPVGYYKRVIERNEFTGHNSILLDDTISFQVLKWMISVGWYAHKSIHYIYESTFDLDIVQYLCELYPPSKKEVLKLYNTVKRNYYEYGSKEILNWLVLTYLKKDD
jgi:hypothetical protein